MPLRLGDAGGTCCVGPKGPLYINLNDAGVPMGASSPLQVITVGDLRHHQRPARLATPFCEAAPCEGTRLQAATERHVHRKAPLSWTKTEGGRHEGVTTQQR